MAWNLAGDSRNSLISSSSATASSAPATSAKVTLGWSFETIFGLALPNCITRFPPPCIEFTMKRKAPKSRITGRKLMSRANQMFSFCFFALAGRRTSRMSAVSSSLYSAMYST